MVTIGMCLHVGKQTFLLVFVVNFKSRVSNIAKHTNEHDA